MMYTVLLSLGLVGTGACLGSVSIGLPAQTPAGHVPAHAAAGVDKAQASDSRQRAKAGAGGSAALQRAAARRYGQAGGRCTAVVGREPSAHGRKSQGQQLQLLAAPDCATRKPRSFM